jgi:hypothetical protein
MLLGLLLAFFVGGVNDGTRTRVLLPIIPFLMVQGALLVDSLVLALQKAKVQGRMQSTQNMMKNGNKMK